MTSHTCTEDGGGNGIRTHELPPRFWAKVEQGPGCWAWTGATQSRGYGSFGISGTTYLVHRLSYEHFYGPVPEGMQILHVCDNPICVNPLHLFLGTLKDNMRDRALKGRNGLFSGENNGRAKLTASQVTDIRKAHAGGRLSIAALADAYGVHYATIRAIVNGKNWKLTAPEVV